MEYRDLNELTYKPLFQEFISHYGLKYFVEGGQVFIFNDCILIQIYSYIIEDYLYFDIFNLKNYTFTMINPLLVHSMNLEEAQQISGTYRKNPQLTKPEALFWEGLYFLRNFYEDLFSCNFSRFEGVFENISENRKQYLQEIFHNRGLSLTFP